MMTQDISDYPDPMNPTEMTSLKHWGDPVDEKIVEQMKEEVSIDCGWGRLLFGQTYTDPQRLAEAMLKEMDGQRDLALYVRDPHVVVSCAPQEIFIDPSLTLRIDFRHYKPGDNVPAGYRVRELQPEDDVTDLNRLYLSRNMVPAHVDFYDKAVKRGDLTILVAEDQENGKLIGAVMGVNHKAAFADPDLGGSLWALVVDPQCEHPAVGEALARKLIEFFASKGLRFLDLSVMHDNAQAIALYEKLGFEQVPVYCIKTRNSINEQLYVGPDVDENLNIYAQIIVDEARRRGIGVNVVDAEQGYFELTLGGRQVTCRESLSELTSAVAMSRCDDKEVTRRVLQKVGLCVPAQIMASDLDEVSNFLTQHRSVVVKPAKGEQGKGIKVGLTELSEVVTAVEAAGTFSDKVLIEEMVRGDDLRIIVIDNQVVAAAIRKPAHIRGDGKRTISELIEYYSRRRSAATQGESAIPIDDETERCIVSAGYDFNEILPEGVKLNVRRTANLHTGGTIHDVTQRLHPRLEQAALKAANALSIPVVGLDFIVPDVEGDDYVIIEANERPGLANHEPQPTAEKFIDLLFPFSRKSESV